RIRTGALLLPRQADWPGFPTSRVLSFADKCPAGVEPARPPWQGGRLPLHHGHDRRPRIVKEPRAPGGSRTHVAALRGRSLRRWTTSARIPMGPEGLEPSPNRLRAGRSAARTSVPIGALSRPGRSRTFAARLSAGCSPVELQDVAVLLLPWFGAGGVEPLVALDTSSVRQSVRPDSNRRSQAPEFADW